MPVLVHVTDKKHERSIRDSGISVGKHNRVVYFMPVVQSHFVSYQWVRELKRKGGKNFIAVRFKLPSEEPVWFGKYNEPHRQDTLGVGIRELQLLDDPLGFEMFVERKITASEVHKIRDLRKLTGWRYFPRSHGKKPCGCPSCRNEGQVNSRKVRDQYELEQYKARPYSEVKRSMLEAETLVEMAECVCELWGKRRREDPSFLAPILESTDDHTLMNLTISLAYFRHKKCRPLLLELCRKPSYDIKEAAVETMFELYGRDAANILEPLLDDEDIAAVIQTCMTDE